MRQIKCHLLHLAGGRVGADTGTVYVVDKATHILCAEGAAEPGVLDGDVAGFLVAGFSEVRAANPAVTYNSPPPPKLPPQPQAALAAASPLPELPAALAEMTEAQWFEMRMLHSTQEWLRLAREAGIALSPEEQGTKPKVALIQLIYRRAVGG